MRSSEIQTATPRLVILGELASGGMGTVWLAHMEGSSERLVALKRMHRHLAAEPEFLNMFLDEIWLTGALRHPNIVKLVGWGIDDQGPYFATEFVLGASLSVLNRIGRAAQFPLPAELVMHVGVEVARGLHAAYTLSGNDGKPLHIVHRDLTPSNVLAGVDGVVKITDFGVAKAARKIVKTRTGVLKGKLHYMSPEYVRGDRDLDARSDLYSLGVLLFELLAGRRPFGTMREYELLTHIARHAPPPIRQFMDLDDELANLIDALRANDPADRPADAAEVAGHLERLLVERGFPVDVRRGRMADYVKVHGRSMLDDVAAVREHAARSQRPLSVLAPEQVTHTSESEQTTAVRATAAPAAPPTRAVAAVQPRGTTTVVSPARPHLATRPKRAPTTLAVALVTIVLGFAGGVLATRWGAAPPATGSASAAVSVVPLPPPSMVAAPSAPPTPASARPTEASMPSAPASAPPHVTAAASPRHPPVARRRRPNPTSVPKRSCTPLDFDYPNCRK